MARVKGNDVMVQLLDAVGELKLGFTQMRERVERMELELARQQLEMAQLRGTVERIEVLLGRVSKLLGQSADHTRVRFEEIEERLERLEA